MRNARNSVIRNSVIQTQSRVETGVIWLNAYYRQKNAGQNRMCMVLTHPGTQKKHGEAHRQEGYYCHKYQRTCRKILLPMTHNVVRACVCVLFAFFAPSCASAACHGHTQRGRSRSCSLRRRLRRDKQVAHLSTGKSKHAYRR